MPIDSERAESVSLRLEKAIGELQDMQNLLISGEDIDSRILTDFRDSVNRVRNTAWSAQQYLLSKATGEDSAGVFSILAGERVRAAYQLCQAIEADLGNREVRFQTGQLIQLHQVVTILAEQLGKAIKEAE